MSEFSDEQIIEAINRAIREHNLGVIPGLLVVLAQQAPEKAQAALDLMQIGAELSARIAAGNPEGKGADDDAN